MQYLCSKTNTCVHSRAQKKRKRFQESVRDSVLMLTRPPKGIHNLRSNSNSTLAIEIVSLDVIMTARKMRVQ